MGVPGPDVCNHVLLLTVDPRHEERDDMVDWLEWIGHDFDPDKFDLKEVNLGLKAIR